MDAYAKGLISNFLGAAITVGAVTLLFAMSFPSYGVEFFSWKRSTFAVAILVLGLIACAVALAVMLGLPPSMPPAPK